MATNRTQAPSAIRPTTVINSPKFTGDTPVYQYHGLSREQLASLGLGAARCGLHDGIHLRRRRDGRYDLFAVASQIMERDATFRRFLAAVLSEVAGHE